MTENRSITATFTSTNPCTYTVSPTEKSLAYKGGSINVTVKATGATTCENPSISSSGDWVTGSVKSFKNNKGTVKLTAAANSTTTTRTATVTIGTGAFTITQSGTPCSIAVSPTNGTLTSTGGTGSFTVTAPTGCAWTAGVASTATWLSVASTTGTGSGSVSYTGSENATGKARSGKITVYLTDTPTKKKVFTVKETK